jgi:hypothetical protein
MIEISVFCLKFFFRLTPDPKADGTNDRAYLLLQGIAPQAREGNSDAKNGTSYGGDLKRAVAGHFCQCAGSNAEVMLRNRSRRPV